MRSHTATITIEAPRDRVFAFTAQPPNLPRWAVGFARAIRPEDGAWTVETPNGTMVPVRYVTDGALGVVDFVMGSGAGPEQAAHARVLPNGEGTELVFTQFQGPGVPDEAFTAQVRALEHELVVLKALVEVECPL